jgi:hypothetical protein
MANQNVLAYTLPEVMPAAIATGLFVSLCTIQQPDGLFVDAGQPSGNFVNVAGFIDIPCTAPPTSDLRITADEKKSLEKIETFSSLHVLLGGYYPGVEYGTGKGWRAVVDGYPFDLLGAEHDSQKQMTRLAVRFSAT